MLCCNMQASNWSTSRRLAVSWKLHCHRQHLEGPQANIAAPIAQEGPRHGVLTQLISTPTQDMDRHGRSRQRLSGPRFPDRLAAEKCRGVAILQTTQARLSSPPVGKPAALLAEPPRLPGNGVLLGPFFLFFAGPLFALSRLLSPLVHPTSSPTATAVAYAADDVLIAAPVDVTNTLRNWQHLLEPLGLALTVEKLLSKTLDRYPACLRVLESHCGL